MSVPVDEFSRDPDTIEIDAVLVTGTPDRATRIELLVPWPVELTVEIRPDIGGERTSNVMAPIKTGRGVPRRG